MLNLHINSIIFYFIDLLKNEIRNGMENRSSKVKDMLVLVHREEGCLTKIR